MPRWKPALSTAAIDTSQRIGWLTTGLGIAQICSWGSLFYSFPLIAEAMRTDLGWTKPEIYVAASLGLALAALAAYPVGAAIDRADRLHITEVHAAPEGDTCFPPIDPARWREVERQGPLRTESDSAAVSFVTYDRA
jgi:hypothetical protein